MDVNDFVILPGSKTGMSAKLKAKSVRELQLEKVQLELDNKEMERKLQQLQLNMSREKLERERANGYHWKTGQAGLALQPQLSQNKENAAKVCSGKVKLRVLKEEPQVPEPAKQLVERKVASAASTEKPKVKGKPCGQCETKSALLVCLDCGEDYCPSCFARVHQKGALKLHRTTCLQAKARVPVGKLEAAQQFLGKIYLDESNGKINYEPKKEVHLSEHPPDISSPLPKMPMDDTEEASTMPAGVMSKCQNGGSLLHGTFNEEESAKLFQEAVNRWRSGNSIRKQTEERCCQCESENTETCEAQTSPPVMKKAMEIQFKEDSLKYVDRLWLKKFRRTPLDMLPDVLADALHPTKSLLNEACDTLVGEEEEEEEEEEEVENARLAAEAMRKYWADITKEEPEAVPVNTVSSLKIEILEDACEEAPEESASFVITEAGSDEFDEYSGTMSEDHKTEPDIFLAHAVGITTRSPLSSVIDKENDLTFLHSKHEETPRASTSSAQSEVMDALCDPSGTEVSSIPCDRATMKEKRTLLQEVALRKKPICTPYRGLEGFFARNTSSLDVKAASFPSPCTDRHSPSNGISFSGSEQWIRHFSFSECADETVVQNVLNLEFSRPSSRLGRQSPSLRASLSMSSSERATLGPSPANKPCYRNTEHAPRPSSALQRVPRSSAAAPLSRAASEISEIEGIDVTEHDDLFLEDSTDQQALADLESELRSNADLQQELGDLISDSPAFNRDSKMTSPNCTAFHNIHEIKEYSKSDTIRVYDGHTDDEEDLWQDMQQVMELH